MKARDWVLFWSLGLIWGSSFLWIKIAVQEIGPFTLVSWGEQSIDSAVASILNGTVPLFAMVIAHFALADDRMTAARVAGLILGFAGVVVLMSGGLAPGQLAPGG